MPDKYYTNEEMVEMLKDFISENYSSNRDYCTKNGIDTGNLSRALNGKGVLTPQMIEPMGYEKGFQPVYVMTSPNIDGLLQKIENESKGVG